MRTWILGLLTLHFLSRSVLAQPASSDLEYQLQPGDQLEINIFVLPELEKKYSVRADGTIYHPYAGDIKAAGLNLKQLESLLQQRFRKQLKKPGFRVGLASLTESEVAVLGEVKTQGKIKVNPGTNVLELLAQVGGVTEKADMDGAVIFRAGKKIPLNLSLEGQAELAAMKVQKGDILYVNRGKRVGVSGEVQAKGVYAVSSKSQNPVEDAIKAAGGATEAGALNRVQIIRPSLSKPLEVNLLDKESASKIGLEDGDTVLLPPRRAVVLGAVSKPGAIPLNGQDSLMEVISSAGLSDKGKIDSLVVIRASEVLSGGTNKEIYNLESNFSEGSPVAKVPIHDGDLVYVPTREEGNMLNNTSSLMSVLWMARSLFSF